MDNILQRRSQNSFKTNLTNMSTRRSKTVPLVHKFTSSRGEQHTGIVEALQTFVFLCSPALRHFASCSSSDWGNVDNQGSCETAYEIIFGAYMAAGVWVA